jgi:hypothetical protein
VQSVLCRDKPAIPTYRTQMRIDSIYSGLDTTQSATRYLVNCGPYHRRLAVVAARDPMPFLGACSVLYPDQRDEPTRTSSKSRPKNTRHTLGKVP